MLCDLKLLAIFSDYYKRTSGIPFMDSFLQELNARFSADNRVLKAVMSLVPLVMVEVVDTDSLAEELLFWERDLPSPDALKVPYHALHPCSKCYQYCICTVINTILNYLPRALCDLRGSWCVGGVGVLDNSAVTFLPT